MRRNIPVRLFNQLPVLVPLSGILIALLWQNNKDRCEGKDRSPMAGVASMMRRTDGSGWLDTIPAQHHFHGRGWPPIAPEPVLRDVPDCHGATQRGYGAK